MRISDWSSDVCSSDLGSHHLREQDHAGLRSAVGPEHREALLAGLARHVADAPADLGVDHALGRGLGDEPRAAEVHVAHLAELLGGTADQRSDAERSEEHPPELQSLMRMSYAVFCLTKQQKNTITPKYQ